MAGRTLQQAMAYLGLAEQAEPEPQPRRKVRAEERYGEDEYRNEFEDDFQGRDVFTDESELAYDSLPVADERLAWEDQRSASAQNTANFYGDEEPASEPLAPIIDPGVSGSRRAVAAAERPENSRTTPAISDRNESENELRRITTIHPRSYNDAKIIGESFRENIPVIMNVTDMGESEAKRLVDFSAGLAFALHGSIERVTDKVFLLTPANLEVLGAEGAEVPVALDSDSSDLFNQG